MSLRKPAKDQPESFEFNTSSLEAVNIIVAKYKQLRLKFVNFFQTHRSTSPKTISSEPKTAGTSANI